MTNYIILETGLENKVLVLWEQNKEFSIHTIDLNNNNLSNGNYYKNFMEAQVAFNEFRDKEIDIIEYCPYCEGESILKNTFEEQSCSECGEKLLPCNMCEMDYVNCDKDCVLNK